MSKSIPRAGVPTQAHQLPGERLGDAESAQTRLPHSKMTVPASTADARRRPGSYATPLGSAPYLWGVSAIFENREGPELRGGAAAMAAFAVEPQAPTLGE